MHLPIAIAAIESAVPIGGGRSFARRAVMRKCQHSVFEPYFLPKWKKPFFSEGSEVISPTV